MRKCLKVLASFSALALAASAQAGLILNPGFESGSADWSLGGRFSVTTADKNSGSSSLLINGTGSYSISRSTAITVSPNTQYDFSYYFKSNVHQIVQLVDGPNSWDGVTMTTMDDQWKFLDGSWHQLSGRFNSGSLSAVQVLIYDQNIGNSYVDDLNLTVVPEPASLGLIGLSVVGLLTRRRKA